MFRTGATAATTPPNNWASVFGGPAWTRVGDTDQWYLHLFDTTQPDFDWRNPEVGDLFEGVLRFWLERGVDGFRVDVAHGLFKEASLRDQVLPSRRDATSGQVNTDHSMVSRDLKDEPMWDQPEVHDVYRRWAKVLDEYGADRMAVAEAWTPDAGLDGGVRPARRARPGVQLRLAARATGRPTPSPRSSPARWRAVEPVGSAPTWVLSNHDVVRHTTRYGGGAVGLARARAATLTMLALPGASYIYQGEELGLEQVDVPPADRQDPAWFRTGEAAATVAGCRCRGAATLRRTTSDRVRPAVAPAAGRLGAAHRGGPDGQPGSTLEFYRAALAARASITGGRRRRDPRRARQRRSRLQARRRHRGAQLRDDAGRAAAGRGPHLERPDRRQAARQHGGLAALSRPRPRQARLSGWCCSDRGSPTKAVSSVVGPVLEPAFELLAADRGQRGHPLAALVGGG